jgi:hypothetical protein
MSVRRKFVRVVLRVRFDSGKLRLDSVTLVAYLIGLKVQFTPPRFGWRGLMLDVSRHFESPEFVKHLLDVMAFYKLNIFHWHLTDDQGWRIEIKRYPKLPDIGSKRAQTGPDKTPHSGFYTQAEIRDIVAFAQARNITIVRKSKCPVTAWRRSRRIRN